ncbi:MAG: ribbon-helix-helix protein, CopG family [Actinomycetota bacterium]|nr:ribbon-helix-helix protein, CopG family [Actinomycetota bacterium]
MERRAFTVRLDTDQASDLEAVAAADGVSIAEVIREAVADRIDARRKDPVFQARIRSVMEQNQRVLERLAE